MVVGMFEPIARVCALVINRECALPVAVLLTRRWIWLYTSMAPLEERMDRRAELLSDLHEHISDSRAGGVGQEAIALGVLSRSLRGAPEDLKWSAPYAPTALVERLRHGAVASGLTRALRCGILRILQTGALPLMKRAQAGFNNPGSTHSGGNMTVKILSVFLVACGIGSLVAGGGLTLGGLLLMQRSAEAFGMFIAAWGVVGLVMGGRFVIEGGRQLR